MKTKFFILLVTVSLSLFPIQVFARGKTASQIYDACVLALLIEAGKHHPGDAGYLQRGLLYCNMLADEIDRQAGGK